MPDSSDESLFAVFPEYNKTHFLYTFKLSIFLLMLPVSESVVFMCMIISKGMYYCPSDGQMYVHFFSFYCCSNYNDSFDWQMTTR